MKGDQIRYRGGYKYQLVADYRVQTNIFPDTDIMTEFIELTRGGVLLIRHMYAWDGPSGPTIDTASFMRGSLVHDALAQLMRDGYLSKEQWFEPMNRELQKICIEDGMWFVRAWWVFMGVQYVSGGHWANIGHDRPMIIAP